MIFMTDIDTISFNIKKGYGQGADNCDITVTNDNMIIKYTKNMGCYAHNAWIYLHTILFHEKKIISTDKYGNNLNGWSKFLDSFLIKNISDTDIEYIMSLFNIFKIDIF